MGGMQSRKIVIFILFLVGIFLYSINTLRAEQEGKLDLKATMAKEMLVKKSGRSGVETVPVDQAAPGDTLVLTIAYTNPGNRGVTSAVIVNPVPPGLALKPESGEGQDAEVSFSIDNGRSYQTPPIMLRVKQADGTETVQAAPPERYTHIKWVINKSVMPDQSGRVSFKATVK